MKHKFRVTFTVTENSDEAAFAKELIIADLQEMDSEIDDLEMEYLGSE